MASFQSAWARLRSLIDDTFRQQCLMRVDDEILAQSVGADCVALLRISPSARKVVAGQIGVTVNIGLSYPSVDRLRRSIWETSASVSSSDFYCPLSCSLSALDNRIPSRSFLLSFMSADDRSMQLLKTVVSKVFANEVQSLSRLSGAAELLLAHSESPWFSVLAREDFLPLALLVLGRADESVALVREIRSMYGQSSMNRARVSAYSKFADRVEQLVLRGETTCSMGSSDVMHPSFKSGPTTDS